MVLVHKRTIRTERLPHVGEVSANYRELKIIKIVYPLEHLRRLHLLRTLRDWVNSY
jgi:hypothetical protein